MLRQSHGEAIGNKALNEFSRVCAETKSGEEGQCTFDFDGHLIFLRPYSGSSGNPELVEVAGKSGAKRIANETATEAFFVAIAREGQLLTIREAGPKDPGSFGVRIVPFQKDSALQFHRSSEGVIEFR